MQNKGTVSFLVTTACQNRCRFCFERGSADTMSLPAEFVLRKIRERAPKSVDLAGGEPLLHPDFRAMAEAIRKMGIDLTVTTNGLALCDDDLAAFLAATANRIVLSVHAGTEEDYSQLTGNKEGFALLLRAVANLSRHVHRGQVLVNTTVTVQTWPSIPSVPELVSALEPVAWHVTNPMPIGAAARDYASIVPKISQVRAGIDAVVQAARQRSLDVFFGFFPTCALGSHGRANSDLAEPSQAGGFHVDFDLNPHQTNDLVFERRFAEPCRDCRLAHTDCAGPSAEYLRIFGADELVSVTEIDGPLSLGDEGRHRAARDAPAPYPPRQED